MMRSARPGHPPAPATVWQHASVALGDDLKAEEKRDSVTRAWAPTVDLMNKLLFPDQTTHQPVLFDLDGRD